MKRRGSVAFSAVSFIAITMAAPAMAGNVTSTGSSPRTDAPVEVGNVGWVSNEYLQAHPGFLPGVVSAETTASNPSDSLGLTSPDAVQPLSHTGCNNEVCIDVEGQGTTVTFWGTYAFGGNYSCWRPHFKVWTKNNHQGTLVDDHLGPVICARAGEGVYYDNENLYAGYYPDGWSLCNTWAYISGLDHITGYPCANIIA